MESGGVSICMHGSPESRNHTDGDTVVLITKYQHQHLESQYHSHVDSVISQGWSQSMSLVDSRLRSCQICGYHGYLQGRLFGMWLSWLPAGPTVRRVRCAVFRPASGRHISSRRDDRPPSDPASSPPSSSWTADRGAEESQLPHTTAAEKSNGETCAASFQDVKKQDNMENISYLGRCTDRKYCSYAHIYLLYTYIQLPSLPVSHSTSHVEA